MAKTTLSDYIALLEGRSLLAAPVPNTLDRTAPVELVSYDSREVVFKNGPGQGGRRLCERDPLPGN